MKIQKMKIIYNLPKNIEDLEINKLQEGIENFKKEIISNKIYEENNIKKEDITEILEKVEKEIDSIDKSDNIFNNIKEGETPNSNFEEAFPKIASKLFEDSETTDENKKSVFNIMKKLTEQVKNCEETDMKCLKNKLTEISKYILEKDGDVDINLTLKEKIRNLLLENLKEIDFNKIYENIKNNKIDINFKEKVYSINTLELGRQLFTYGLLIKT